MANQDRLEVLDPTFTSKIILKGEKGLEDLLRMVRNSWNDGFPVVTTNAEIRFEKE